MSEEKAQPKMTHFEAFCFAVGLKPDSKSITRIQNKQGEVQLVRFGTYRVVKKPDAKADECPWRNVWIHPITFMFSWFDERASVSTCPGYLNHIGVTERNLLDDLEVQCRAMKNAPEGVKQTLDILNRIRLNNLYLADKGIEPTN